MIDCDNVTAYIDGELSRNDGWTFRAHLVVCVPCRHAVIEGLQLDAQLSTLRPAPESELDAIERIANDLARHQVVYKDADNIRRLARWALQRIQDIRDCSEED